MDIKNQIIEVAKKLFYEKGFEKTTFRQIADELHISPGSISYHFDSKFDLGNQVYIAYMSEYYVKPVSYYLLDKYGAIDPRLASALDMRLQFYVFQNDKNVFRFYDELFTSSRYNDSDTSMMPYTLLEMPIIRNDRDKMYSIAAKGASVALVSAFFHNELSVKDDEFIDYKVKTALELAGYTSDVAEKYILNSKELFNTLNIEVLPYFEIKIS